MFQCDSCKEAYKDGRPLDYGSDPKCAFDEGGVFTSNNWNCAGLADLRELAEHCEVWCDDQHTALIPIHDTGKFILLSYYKHRGKTEGAWLVNQTQIAPLTVQDLGEIS